MYLRQKTLLLVVFVVCLCPWFHACPVAAAQEQAQSSLLVWQNYSSGDVVWWKVDTQGDIISQKEATGWGLVSDTEKVPEGWDLVGSYPSGDLRILIWHNREKGLVAYWRVSSDGSLVSVDDTGWGLVSSDMRVGSNWELTDITKVGEHEVLFWRNLVSGVVAFWRLNADNKLLDELQGSGWGYVAEGVDLTKGWVLGGIVEINGATTMVWRNEDAGQVAFWRINATNCTMQDLQKGSGWGLVSDQVKVPSNWKLRAVVVVAEQPLLLWQNSANGAIAYWKLTADGELADHVEGSGWGLVQMDPPLTPDCVLAGATVVNQRLLVFLQHTQTGAVYHAMLDPLQLATTTTNTRTQTEADDYGLVAQDLRMDASWTLRAILNSSK